MPVNVKQYTSAGAEVVDYGVIDGTGYFQGALATAPAAGTVAGSPALQLQKVKNFPIRPAEPQRVTNTGDDGAAAQFLFEPIELLQGSPVFGAGDLTFDALITSMLVQDLGDLSIVPLQPSGVTYRDMIIMVQGKSKSLVSGTTGLSMYEGVAVYPANIYPMGRDAFAERAEATYMYNMVANEASAYPWGTAFSVITNGTTKMCGFRWTSPYKMKLERWTGDNTVTGFTCQKTPAVEGASSLLWVNGTLIDYGAGAGKYTVTASTKTFTHGTAPAAASKVIAFYPYIS